MGGEGTTQVTKVRSSLTPIEYTKQQGRGFEKIAGTRGWLAASLCAARISSFESCCTTRGVVVVVVVLVLLVLVVVVVVVGEQDDEEAAAEEEEEEEEEQEQED